MLRFQRWIAIAVIAVFFAAEARPGLGAPEIFLRDSTSPTNSISIRPGDSFTLTVSLTSDVPLTGFTAYLDDMSYTDTTHFTISSRTSAGTNPFQSADANTDDADLTNTPLVGPSVDAVADPALDLGYAQGNAIAAITTEQNIETLTIASAPKLAAGSYQLQFDTLSIVSDANFNSVDFENLSTAYTITVIAPEPAVIYFMPVLICGLLGRPPHATVHRKRSSTLACQKGRVAAL